ncbi:MAG: tetratricopeptide repeat protein [Methanosphaera sp.]|nr:tetratricopeptide repeat protein [Methanosphaera sp.]
MPILLLKNTDIDLISGKRNITIRRLWKQPLYPGDHLYCYWNILSKEREKLFEAEVTHVDILPFKDIIHDSDLAIKLGYKNTNELEKDLRKSYPNNTKNDDQFQVFEFKKLKVTQWEGSATNQKNMIIKKADVLFDMGEYDQSALCYKAALEYDSDDINLLNRIGDNLSRIGQIGDAIKYYKKAIKLDPDNEYLYNNIAIAYLNRQDLENAYKYSSQALNINSENTTVLYWRGIIYEMLNDFEKSLECFDYIIKIDDNDHDAWNERGTVLNMLGRSEEALESYDKSIEVCLDEEEDSNVWASKANTLLDLQRYGEAIDSYKRALEIDDTNPIILNNMGVAYMELDDFHNAIECFRRVLASHPDNLDAQILQEACLENL